MFQEFFFDLFTGSFCMEHSLHIYRIILLYYTKRYCPFVYLALLFLFFRYLSRKLTIHSNNIKYIFSAHWKTNHEFYYHFRSLIEFLKITLNLLYEIMHCTNNIQLPAYFLLYAAVLVVIVIFPFINWSINGIFLILERVRRQILIESDCLCMHCVLHLPLPFI